MHVVILGLGSIGRRHAQNIAAIRPDVRFTFVRSNAVEDDFTRRLSARVVADLADSDPASADLVVVATPSDRHVDALGTLIGARCPLLVEKPVVATLADCDDVEQLLSESPGVVRVVGFNLRYLPSLRRVRELVTSGQLGRVVRASFTAGQWLPAWRPDVDYRTVYSASSAEGGGVELDLAHEFDLARWLFGDLDVRFALGGQLSSLELAANDTSTSVLTPPRAIAPVVTVTLDYLSRPRIRRYDIVGDAGTVQWDIDGSLRVETGDGVTERESTAKEFDVGATYVSMIEAVFSAVQSGDLGGVQTLEDGITSTRLALSVRNEGRAT